MGPAAALRFNSNKPERVHDYAADLHDGAATMLAAGHLSTRGFVLLLTLFPGIVTILPRMLYG